MSVFQLQSYRVLSHPMEAVQALVDPRLVGLFRRILKGEHDCAICRRTLDLDPKNDSSPGLLGYVHGDFAEKVEMVCLAACCGCVRRLGDELAARTMCQEFADTCCGGGTVELVQSGNA